MSFSLNISRTSITFFWQRKHNTEHYWSYSSYLNQVASYRNTRENEKNLISIKRLFLIRDLVYSLRIFTLVKTIRWRTISFLLLCFSWLRCWQAVDCFLSLFPRKKCALIRGNRKKTDPLLVVNLLPERKKPCSLDLTKQLGAELWKRWKIWKEILQMLGYRKAIPER